MSPTFDWQPFLSRWSSEILSTELAAAFPAQVRADGWVGYPGATEAEIAQAEARLDARLPPSYRAFLQVSNGWRMVVPLLGRLWPVQEAEYLRARRSSLIEDWRLGEELFGPPEPVPDERYFIYGEAQETATLRSEYLTSALEISDLDSRDGSIYLLNPQVVTPEGEWEAWYFAAWLPGAVRYRSFWELMQGEYRRYLEAVRSIPEWAPEFLAYARERLQPAESMASAVQVTALIEELQRLAEGPTRRTDPEPGRPPGLPAYQRGMAEAFQTAAERVREIRARAGDEQELRGQLNALAGELDRLGRAGMKKAMKDFNRRGALAAAALDTLTGSMEKMDQRFQSSGKPVGYRTAAELIRSYLT